MHKSAKLSDFGIYKLNKATNDTVLTLQLFVNACSPEGATTLSSTFSALYQFCLLKFVWFCCLLVFNYLSALYFFANVYLFYLFFC